MSANGPSCFLLGADTLLIECGEILRGAGWQIRGVITDARRVADWAHRHELPVLAAAPSAAYAEALRSEPFDYLFSIANLSMVPADVLALPSKRAINFHDGPLPRYAGLNAPAWAIANGEGAHGISWHEMVAAADEGDLLAQRIFDIAPDETSVSLNTKCFEAAIDTFGELARQLAAGSETPRAQDLSARSYFGKHDRPERACILDFTRPATELSALVRALDFGRYANPIGTATLRAGERMLAVTAATAREEDSDVAPGTVLGADDTEITVATGAGTLALRAFAHLCGTPVSPAEALAHLSLEVGSCLSALSEETAARLTARTTALSRAEAFWRRRLVGLEPASIPFARPAAGAAETLRVEVPVPAGFAADGGDVLIAAVGAYLARLGDKDDFHVSFRERSETADASRDLEPWISTHVPLRVRVAAGASFAAFREQAAAELARVRRRGPWLRDLVGRTPALRGRRDLAQHALPVALELGPEPERLALPAGSLLSFAVAAGGDRCLLVHDASRLPAEEAARIAEQLGRFLEWLAEAEDRPLTGFRLLTDAERERMLVRWNESAVDYPRDKCVHELFEAQVERTPDTTAVAFEDGSLSYRELNERANQLAARLRELGVGPDRLVGVCVERSLDLLVAIYGVLKAGGAYVPLDPSYPSERVAFMLEDSQAPVVVTQQSLADRLPETGAHVLCLDRDASEIAGYPAENIPAGAAPSDLAYVIYTSGSTGQPKGVMVEHRNVVNFFAGMDERVEHEPAGTWLAVTSLSFDISVLELFWTLARGFRVVLASGGAAATLSASRAAADDAHRSTARGMDMGLFFWGNDDGPGPQKYRLLLECAKFADQNGFSSVWTPERHFHAFGGPFPNAATISAAIAATTSRVGIRSGCVVLPLHHPIRVAEEWAVVDNLSDGRVGLGIAAGWMPNDFVIRPEGYDDKKKVMFESIETLRKLWRGEAVSFRNGKGELTETQTLPRPVQPEVPIWITTAGNPESYEQAGEAGAHLLTHLLGQTVEEVAERIGLYRAARARAGFDPDTGQVTLMLHTFVGEDDEQVRELVRGPMKSYLGSAVSLVAKYAWTFPTYQRPGGKSEDELDELTEADIASLTADEADVILEHAFERYFETSGLFGSPETCLRMVDRLKEIGVDEIGCLMDYGVPTDQVLDSLPHLRRLREMANPEVRKAGAAAAPGDDGSIPALVERHGVTHLQCTPSLAHMLTASDEGRRALAPLRQLMVGGEAFPASLARELDGVVAGTVTNMYGPTETTTWSSTADVTGAPQTVSIGRPIANTQMYVLDRALQPVPIGAPGELYIGGDGVVRGYLGRPELTAERFVPDPFRAGEARLYRTGDLARWRADGTLEFLGRSDFQVKIRGHRIELGEIESWLGQHPSVRECVVTAREDNPGDQRLVAYLVAARTTPLPTDLRDHLRAQLPEHMIPSHFTILPELPLTPNGKVDRAALPVPDASDQRAEVSYVEPTDDLEEGIAGVWRETLGLAEVGIDDNFFDIGGHSLLVVRVHRRLAEVASQPVSLTDLYRFPTVRSLAAFLRGEGDGAAATVGTDRGARRRAARERRRRRGRS